MSNGSDSDEPLDPFLRFDLLRTRATRGDLALPADVRHALRRAPLLRLTPPRGRAEASSSAAAEETAPAALLSDIAIQLVNPSGHAIAGEPFRITLSDGREESGKLDARGLARFGSLPRGSCKISFPELHKNPRRGNAPAAPGARRPTAKPASGKRGAATPGATDPARGAAPAAGAAADAAADAGFDLTVVDATDRPLAGARVRVSQAGREIQVGTLDPRGMLRVKGHDASLPCEVSVLDHPGGCVAVQGGYEEDGPDGVLPDYDPGEAGTREEGC